MLTKLTSIAKASFIVTMIKSYGSMLSISIESPVYSEDWGV